MKKIFTVIMITALVLSLAACGSSETSSNGVPEIDALLEQGYTQTLSSYEDGVLLIEYASEDHSDLQLAKCNATEDQSNGFFEIDMSAEDYDAQCSEYLAGIGDVTLVSLADKIPDTADVEAFVGSTIEDLEAAGYEQTSVGTDSDGIMFLEYSDADHTYQVYPEEDYESLFELAEEDLKALVIGKISFYDFASLPTEE